MTTAEASVARVSEAFALAPFEPERWLSALHGLAELTRSPRGQLIGLGGPAVVPFNWVSNFAEGAMRDFVGIGGADPRVNPRVAAAGRAGILQTVSEAHYEQIQASLRTDVYADYSRQYGIEHGCQTNLLREQNMLVGLAVLRSRREGPTTEEDRAAFAHVAPHVVTAVRMQIALESQGAQLLAGALEAMSVAAFLCDGGGEVRALTPPAEALVRAGDRLRLCRRGLSLDDRVANLALQQAIRRAICTCGPREAAARTIVTTRREVDRPSLTVEVVALPGRAWSFSFLPRVLIVVRGWTEGDKATVESLRASLGLTKAEADVALRLSEGQTRDAIAVARAVSPLTVQAQIKAVFRKLDINREMELAAVVARHQPRP